MHLNFFRYKAVSVRQAKIPIYRAVFSIQRIDINYHFLRSIFNSSSSHETLKSLLQSKQNIVVNRHVAANITKISLVERGLVEH